MTWSASELLTAQRLTERSVAEAVGLQTAEYKMSQDSPRETEELEPAPQSPDDHELPQPDGDMSRVDDQGDHGTGYDFEVKEQDRWLPIANGECASLHLASLFLDRLRTPACPCPCPPVACAMLLPSRWESIRPLRARHQNGLPCTRRRCTSTYNGAARLASAGPVESEVHPPAYDLQPPTRAVVLSESRGLLLPRCPRRRGHARAPRRARRQCRTPMLTYTILHQSRES